MRWFRPLFVFICATLAWSADETLAATLAKMDTVAAGFKGLRADVRQLSHTAVINEDAVDTGTIAVRRPKPKTCGSWWISGNRTPKRSAWPALKC